MAVNHRGDTDSTGSGSISASILGLPPGEQGIPDYYDHWLGESKGA